MIVEDVVRQIKEGYLSTEKLTELIDSAVKQEWQNTKAVAYKEGVKSGIRRFAWWRDGVEYVGTSGTTLKKAIEDIEQEDKRQNAPWDGGTPGGIPG